jgi:hypothetical protein
MAFLHLSVLDKMNLWPAVGINFILDQGQENHLWKSGRVLIECPTLISYEVSSLPGTFFYMVDDDFITKDSISQLLTPCMVGYALDADRM